MSVMLARVANDLSGADEAFSPELGTSGSQEPIPVRSFSPSGGYYEIRASLRRDSAGSRRPWNCSKGREPRVEIARSRQGESSVKTEYVFRGDGRPPGMRWNVLRRSGSIRRGFRVMRANFSPYDSTW